MGGDGGTKAVNRQFFRGAKGDKFNKKADKYDKTQVSKDRALFCAYSSKKLEVPIVACELGFLYNKEDIIKGLLEKDLSESFPHITKLKSLINLSMENNPAYPNKSETPFMCPITQTEMNGLNPFVVLRKTGKVISKKALDNIEYNDKILDLFPTDEEANLRRRKLSKKRKKRTKKEKEKRIKIQK